MTTWALVSQILSIIARYLIPLSVGGFIIYWLWSASQYVQYFAPVLAMIMVTSLMMLMMMPAVSLLRALRR